MVMLVLIDIMHLGDQVDLQEAQDHLDHEMSTMGFTKLKELNEARVRHVYYELFDMRMGVRPEYLNGKILELNQRPDRYRLECKLIANRNMA
jgi:hypothetical protein